MKVVGLILLISFGIVLGSLSHPLAQNVEIKKMPEEDARALKQTRSTYTENLENYQTTEYFGTVFVGTPPQRLTAIMDTGSSNFWVPSVGCTGSVCNGKNKYNSASSSTSNATTQAINIHYGAGVVAGTIVYDTVSVGGLSVANVKFAQINSMSTYFATTPYDGIMGFAYDSISTDSIPTWFEDAVSQTGMDSVFSFYLDSVSGSNSSVLTIGGYDSNYFVGSLKYYSLYLSLGDYYTLAFSKVTIGSTTYASCSTGVCLTIVDTGTPFIVGPTAAINSILAALSVATDCSNASTRPNVSIYIGSDVYDIPASIYIIRTHTLQGSTICTPGFTGSGSATWVWGDVFIRAWYSVFRHQDKQVGFAKSINW